MRGGNRHAFEFDTIQLCVGEQARLVLVEMQERRRPVIESAVFALDQSAKAPDSGKQRFELLQRCRRRVLHAV